MVDLVNQRKGDPMNIVAQNVCYRVEHRHDGYYAVSVQYNGLPSISARAIGPCVSEKQAHFLANAYRLGR